MLLDLSCSCLCWILRIFISCRAEIETQTAAALRPVISGVPDAPQLLMQGAWP